MRLPNAENAIVDRRKITHYLLSKTHPEGAPKAKFFESFGFTRPHHGVLRRALLVHAATGIVIATNTTHFGTIYEVNGRIESPDGANPWLLVVWMIDAGADRPRLISAVPSEDKT